MLKAFIADDHDTCRLALKLTVLLTKQFEIVGEASTGRGLVEAIIAKEPDVAIVDLSLPSKNGFEVFDELRKNGSKTKVIIYTAHTDGQIVQEAIAAGVDGYLCKGAPIDVVKQALAAVVDGQQWIDPSVIRPTAGPRPSIFTKQPHAAMA